MKQSLCCSFIMMAAVLATGAASAADGEEVALGAKQDYSVLKESQWTMTDTKWATTVFKGKKAMRLEGWRAMATLKDMAFEDGTIELDIAAGGAGDYYIGVAFRVQDKMNRNVNDNENYKQLFENVIFRPFRSGTPRAVQYAAAGTKYDWKYLRNNHPGKYEGNADLSETGWSHVRIEVAGQQAQVFVNNAKTPALVVNDLKHGRSKGSVGITSVWKTAYFANVTVTKRKPKQADIGLVRVDGIGLAVTQTVIRYYDALVSRDKVTLAKVLHSEDPVGDAEGLIILHEKAEDLELRPGQLSAVEFTERTTIEIYREEEGDTVEVRVKGLEMTYVSGEKTHKTMSADFLKCVLVSGQGVKVIPKGDGKGP